MTRSYNTGKFKRRGKWGTKDQSGNSFESSDDDDDFGRHEVGDKHETVLKENEMPLIQSLIPSYRDYAFMKRGVTQTDEFNKLD